MKRAATLAVLLAAASSATAQRAPGAPDPGVVAAQIARVQDALAHNAQERARIDRELRDLQAAIGRLRTEQQRLESERARLQSELAQLRSQPK